MYYHGPFASTQALSSIRFSLPLFVLHIKANGQTLVAKLADNTSGVAFKKHLQEHDGSITINIHDYGSFEKVGPLGTSIVQNNKSITTDSGDVSVAFRLER